MRFRAKSIQYISLEIWFLKRLVMKCEKRVLVKLSVSLLARNQSLHEVTTSCPIFAVSLVLTSPFSKKEAEFTNSNHFQICR